jgi:hypothetical protein
MKNMDVYAVTKLIRILQDNTGVDLDVLVNIEWTFLPVLVHAPDAGPKTLRQKLADDPAFFCEIIQHCYRSMFEDPKQQVDEAKAAIATNGLLLLDNWKTVPGTQSNGEFSKQHFIEWFDSVIETCKASGHFEIALYRIGYVLIYAPPDSTDLWIQKDIAELLNREEYSEMLKGYRMGTINLRGVHYVDPTGAPEYQLASDYNKKADNMDQLGYYRVADSMRGIADFYKNEAERNQERGVY